MKQLHLWLFSPQTKLLHLWFFPKRRGRGTNQKGMRHETTTLRRPRTWIKIAFALGQVALLAGLAVATFSPRIEVRIRPLISVAEMPAQLR